MVRVLLSFLLSFLSVVFSMAGLQKTLYCDSVLNSRRQTHSERLAISLVYLESIATAARRDLQESQREVRQVHANGNFDPLSQAALATRGSTKSWKLGAKSKRSAGALDMDYTNEV